MVVVTRSGPLTRYSLRRIAIVALARKLLVSLWRYLTQDLVPDGAALKAA
jgi:transposase